MAFPEFVGSSAQTLTNAMQHAAPYCVRFVGLFQYRAVAVLTLTASTVGASLLGMSILAKALVVETGGDPERASNCAFQVVNIIGLVAFIGGVNIGVSKLLKLPLHWAISAYLTCLLAAITLGIKNGI